MSSVIVVGAQWGDEGKAKIVDILSEDADIIIRYNGGCNSGHTVIDENGVKTILRLISAGILRQDKICCLGNGMAINPWVLFQEIEMLNTQGIKTQGRIVVSNEAHVTLPFHILLDRLNEDRRGSKQIGTTLSGIGPTYRDKINRRGIRMGVFMNEKRLEDELSRLTKEVLEYDGIEFDAGQVIKDSQVIRDRLLSEITVMNVSRFLNEAFHNGKSLVFEGAQGTLLDIDHGTYPYVTASNSCAGGACTGAGIGPTNITDVLGVIKAYVTRVGKGPFPTELKGDDSKRGDSIRERGQEYGTVTGRERRIGDPDVVISRHAADISGIRNWVMTKLDVLTNTKLRIAVSYKIGDKEVYDFPDDEEDLKRVIPVYMDLPGWTEDISSVREFDALPKNTKNFVTVMGKLIGGKFKMISVGARRDQTIIM